MRRSAVSMASLEGVPLGSSTRKSVSMRSFPESQVLSKVAKAMTSRGIHGLR